MAEKKSKRYLELQMEELKASFLAEGDVATPKKATDNKGKNAEMAKLYEDAAEYEADLKLFEDELEIVNANALKDIAAALIKEFPEEDKERNYTQELNTIVDQGWTQAVEVEKTHPAEQLALVKETKFEDIVEKLSEAYPDYSGNFEAEVRALLVQRWGNLIAIKKEHVKQEHAEIYTSGLKPKYVKRAYEQYHGIIK